MWIKVQTTVCIGNSAHGQAYIPSVAL